MLSTAAALSSAGYAAVATSAVVVAQAPTSLFSSTIHGINGNGTCAALKEMKRKPLIIYSPSPHVKRRFPAPPPLSSTSTSSLPSSEDQVVMTTDALNQFMALNSGTWKGSFYQFDGFGNMLQNIETKLAVSSYGEDELISLIQTLYIKQARSSTSISGIEEGDEWTEYKIKETNMFTVDKYQQIGFFPQQKAFALRYQTAGMLETVLRAGVLGEDDVGDENPKWLRIPSKRPSIVCENCLYSMKSDMRTRAFHIMDPSGVLEMLLVFIEQRTDQIHPLSSVPLLKEDSNERLLPFLGEWKGQSVTKRTGLYGATIAEADTISRLKLDRKGQLTQETISTSVKGTSTVPWTGTVSGNQLKFEGGFQVTLLPGGMYMACPSNLVNNVATTQSFHLELCWMESPDKRQRLVRTFDPEGLAVSSTYIYETRS